MVLRDSEAMNRFSFPGGHVRVPVSTKGALDHIIAAGRCRVGDLPIPDIKDRVAFASSLVQSGFLSIAME